MSMKKKAIDKSAKRKASLDALYKDMQQSMAEQEQSANNGVKPTQTKTTRPAGNVRTQSKKQAKSVQQKPERKAGSVRQKSAQKAQPMQSVQNADIPVEKRKAVNKAVNNAVNKNRAKSQKKRGSRGGNYVLYYLFAAAIVVVVFVILAKTVLFDCGTIIVNGNVRYTADEIIAKSGISIGTSLLDIDTEKARSSIVSSLAYIDAAEVKKSYPTKIEIDVTEAQRWYIVKQGNRPYIISHLGKIIEETPDSTLPVIIGFEPKDPVVGGMLVSEEEGKTALPAQVLAAAQEAELVGITTIDITDRFEITVVVEDRVTLLLGLSTSLENKLSIARELIENEISATESVTVNVTNPEKVYVRDNNMIDNPVEAPVLPVADTAESSETDE